ncbi:MAG: hypothetical protein CL607_09635 [Anaerolineaceae bacterium]|nr:hypothetical protein [Anaerolineaceae bacterium]
MQEIKQLLHDYIVGVVSSEEFVIQYLALARTVRDKTWMVLDKSPEVKEQLYQLSVDRFEEKISELEYQQKWEYLTNQLEKVSVKPYSKEEKILSHLFVEADAYKENPEDREAGLHIGETELRTEAQKALDVLNSLNKPGT